MSHSVFLFSETSLAQMNLKLYSSSKHVSASGHMLHTNALSQQAQLICVLDFVNIQIQKTWNRLNQHI